ncbi:MAG: hypothetical protein Q9209_007097 [Squamulea sp. 1 TL-2023]
MAQPTDHPQTVDSTTPHAQSNGDTTQDEREATELYEYHVSSERDRGGSATQSSTAARSPSAVKTFWRRHVVATVPHEACRDHFALERTYLGYVRTSLALAFLGVFIAQLFRLQHTENPNPVFGYFDLAIPLSCICTGAAIVVSLLGAYRFWRQQNAMLRGKILCGGWEVHATLVAILVPAILLFVVVLTVSTSKG